MPDFATARSLSYPDPSPDREVTNAYTSQPACNAILTQPDLASFEIVPTDYALAYSALARRMSAIEAVLRNNKWPQPLIDKLRPDVEGGMAVIEQVETKRFVVKSISP